MTSALDMPLDDLIKANKQQQGGRGGGGSGSSRGRGRAGYSNSSSGRGGGRGADSFNGSAAGPIRRGATLSSFRPSPYGSFKPAPRAEDGPWQHDLFEEAAGGGLTRRPLSAMGIETGTKLFISNLDYGVSNEDIKELFAEVGDLKRSFVHFDKSGRSQGTAEVLYSRRADAVAAMKRYNNVQLDGKPMKIELVGTNLSIPAPPGRTMNGTAPAGRAARGAAASGARGREETSRRGRGRGRGREVKTAADLDAELDSYHAEAMQIS